MGCGKRIGLGGFVDRCVIYYEPEDKCWVAHSLRTDQIGTGGCVVQALASLLRAVAFVTEDADTDPTLVVFRDAPQEVQDMLRSAERLPEEVLEIAHKMVTGEWPKDIEPNFTADHDHPYETSIREDAVTV